MVNYSTGDRVLRTNNACAYFDRSTNVLSVSYTVHIRFVRYTSVTRTLVDRSLSVTCSVRLRSLRLPRRPSPPPRRFPSPDKYFLHFFCPFDNRYLYPLICDSTIYIRQHHKLFHLVFYTLPLIRHAHNTHTRARTPPKALSVLLKDLGQS